MSSHLEEALITVKAAVAKDNWELWEGWKVAKCSWCREPLDRGVCVRQPPCGSYPEGQTAKIQAAYEALAHAAEGYYSALHLSDYPGNQRELGAIIHNVIDQLWFRAAYERMLKAQGYCPKCGRPVGQSPCGCCETAPTDHTMPHLTKG